MEAEAQARPPMIIIFKSDLTTAATLDARGNIAHIADVSLREPLEEFIAQMRAEKPRLRTEASIGIARQVARTRIEPGDPRHEEALVFELRERGFSAAAVGPELEWLLGLLQAETFSAEQRRHFISIMRNLPPSEAKEVAETIGSVVELSKMA